jgi:hypothetical protein
MNKKAEDSLQNYLMLAEILLRISSLEKILLSKGLFTKEEYVKIVEEVSSEAAKNILNKAMVSGDLDKIVDDLKKDPSKFEKN